MLHDSWTDCPPVCCSWGRVCPLGAPAWGAGAGVSVRRHGACDGDLVGYALGFLAGDLSVAHEYLDYSYLVFQAMAACGHRLQIDPVCRLPVTQRNDLEAVAGRGLATAKGGSVKSRRLGQICLGSNTAVI